MNVIEGKFSPVFNKKKQPKLNPMNFPDAMLEVIQGKKITRIEWNDKEEYGFLHTDFLAIHTKGENHTWLVSKADILATDWILVEELN